MLQYRRHFPISLFFFFASVAALPPWTRGQSHHKGMPDPPTPADPRQRDKLEAESGAKTTPSGVLLQREKEYRADIDKLFQWASELRDETRNTPGTPVLSVATYKRLQEIEKLAKKMQKEVKS